MACGSHWGRLRVRHMAVTKGRPSTHLGSFRGDHFRLVNHTRRLFPAHMRKPEQLRRCFIGAFDGFAGRVDGATQTQLATGN
jgi:hypothetical protein